MAHVYNGNQRFFKFLSMLLVIIAIPKSSALSTKDTVFESRDTIGQNFIMTFMDNHQTHTSDPYVLITAVTKGETTVSITAKSHNSTHIIQYKSSVYVDLPNSLVARTADSHDVAVQITSDKDIHVAAIDSDSTTTDGFQALPVDALGNEYYVMSFDAPAFEFSEFAITAVRPATNVTITLAHDVVFQSKTYRKGEVILKTLDFKETIQIQSFGDTTGTHIIADAPIALQAGTSCAFVPTISSPCDHLIEFMPPISSYGYEYALAPFINTQPGYVYRVLAAYNNTTFLDSSSSDPVTLQAGEHTDYVVDSVSPRWLTSSKPVLVAQYIKSGKLARGKGDPAMAIVPAVEQYTGTVTFTTFNGTSSTTFNNFITITAACRYFQNGVFMLSSNDFNQRIDFWRSYPFGNGMCCKTGSIRKGTYTLRHSDPNAKFLVMTYGINTRVSYLLPAQFAVDRITYKTEDGEVKMRIPTIEQAILECQFEESFCGWTLVNGTNTHWDRKCGLLAQGASNVPTNGVGGKECDYYTFIRETGSTTSFSKVKSPDFIPSNDSVCISVNFFMSGDSGTITTYLVTGTDEDMIWTRRGDHGNFWHPLTVTIDGITSGESYYLTVEALAGTNFTAAIDEVIVGNGPCGVGPARITTPPESATTEWDVSKEFVCEVYGHPQPEIEWLNGERQKMRAVEGKFEISHTTHIGDFRYRSNLTIKSISTYDNGEYFCQTYNSYRSKVMKEVAAFTLMSYSKVIIVSPPKSPTLNIGVNYTLQCSASGGPPPLFKWFRVDGTTTTEIRSNDHVSVKPPVFSIDKKVFMSELVFTGINREDDGKYRCQAKNTVNRQSITKEEDCNVYVITKPDPPNNLVATRATPNSIQVTWNMLFTGNLPITECILTYVDSSKTGFASHLVHITVDKTKFLLGGVDALSQYNISLSCSNKLGVSDPSYASFISTMSKSATVTSINNNDISQVGTAAEKLVCSVNAAPAPSVTWFKSPAGSLSSRTKITPSSKYTVSEVAYKGNMIYESTLTLNSIEISDNMNYYCQATNDNTRSEKSTTLKVVDRPGPVTNIRTESQADNSLVVKWTVGSTGNLPLQTCYVAYIDSNANTLAPDIRYISAKYSKIRISYLRPSTYYNITIACSNSIGYGPAASQAFVRVDGKPIDRYTVAPTKTATETFVLKAVAMPVSSTSVMIVWSSGSYDVNKITECFVIYMVSSGGSPSVQKTFDIQLTMFTLTSLKPETNYDITLKCTNLNGQVAKKKLERVSTMESNLIEEKNPAAAQTGTKNQNTDNSSSSVGIGIGLTLLALLIIILLAAVIVKFRQRRPTKKSVDENGDPLDIFSSSS